MEAFRIPGKWQRLAERNGIEINFLAEIKVVVSHFLKFFYSV